MAKHDELRDDIQNCFKLCNKLDAKYETKYDELKDRQSEYISDIKLLAQGLETIAKSVETHVVDFQRHNDEEMKNYVEIQKNQNSIVSGLKALETKLDTEIEANQSRDDEVQAMKKVQARILKWTAGITGFFVISGTLYELGIISVNLSNGG